MTSAQIIIVVTIVLYLAAMVFVGVYFGKKGSGSSAPVKNSITEAASIRTPSGETV